MYIPKIYKVDNSTEIKEFIKQNSFGILINQVNGKPWGTHIPIELDVDIEGNDILLGHISKANPQWKNFNSEKEVLCIFNGPHAYVSSSWYDYEEVPTWNYIAIHVYGEIKIIQGDELYTHLKKLVNKYEEGIENRVYLERMSQSTLKQMGGIVGFQISINEIHAAKKMSQNKSKTNHSNIINQLAKSEMASSRKIAEIMRKESKE